MAHSADTRKADTQKIDDLLSDVRIGMLATTGPDGAVVSRPMAHQESDGATVWFFAHRASRKVEHVLREPSVLLTYSATGTWLSLRGRASVVSDADRLRELWTTAAEAWLPEGPDSPESVLLRVDLESAEYWDTPGSKIATTIAYAKSKLTGERPDLGEHDKVDLT
ncbi:pyridoxamine 5'-phosphate oxidase family protein [Actinokineospora bangkokensis]|uniref:General stress protein FMN-binding split barrel domain-containing protein n=1 Tax=Actinokineospora bangkokensis TaxID=1193682 RepID=A0A1Q9LMK0_9PSEU|nr:pyridoxamine 5'-phosphate oxidase family protein [Actinokineospora bangkokensis]OLR93262.1 hypothetical protein BJP25_17415 [Actinokineospora bangkokensis]